MQHPRLRAAAFILTCALACSAHAQTVSHITSQTCTVALNQCTLLDSAADSIVVQGQWVYSGPVTVTVVTPSGPQLARSCVATRTLVSQTLYKIVDELAVGCNDGSSLAGTYTATRSGSGRGGWAWHSHVSFESWTTY